MRKELEVREGIKESPAFKHHPRRRSDQPKSESHCGVEFARVLEGLAADKFASRMIKKFIFAA
jgi:hypothetical protein